MITMIIKRSRIGKVNVREGLVIVDPGVIKLNLTPPSKFLQLIQQLLFFHLKIILKVLGQCCPIKTINIMKNLIIFVLSVLLIGLAMACNHLTNRLDAASAYIDRLETDYPDYLDTSAESDEYTEWYGY